MDRGRVSHPCAFRPRFFRFRCTITESPRPDGGNIVVMRHRAGKSTTAASGAKRLMNGTGVSVRSAGRGTTVEAVPPGSRSKGAARRLPGDRTGIANVNVEPSPTWLFTQIRLPRSSTNFRHHTGPLHGITPSPRGRKYSFAIPQGFHYDVTTTHGRAFTLWDPLGTECSADDGGHLSVDPHGYVR